MDQPAIKPGEKRKVITGIPGKTGIVYTLDRQTGEFLWARPTVMQNVVSNIDGATGKVTVNPGDDLHGEGSDEADLPEQQRRQELAGRRLQPAHQRDVLSAAEHVHERQDDGGHARSVEGVYGLDMPGIIAPGTRPTSARVYAISAETGKTLWKHEQRAGMLSLVATGGGLVFGGDANGRFRRSTTRPARCCGKSTSARRSAAFR